MMARSDLGHDATVGLMGGDLRGDFTREQFATAQDGDGRFVARRLDREEEITWSNRVMDRWTAAHYYSITPSPPYFFTAPPFGAVCCA
jgi:hypothetical protein